MYVEHKTYLELTTTFRLGTIPIPPIAETQIRKLENNNLKRKTRAQKNSTMIREEASLQVPKLHTKAQQLKNVKFLLQELYIVLKYRLPTTSQNTQAIMPQLKK